MKKILLSTAAAVAYVKAKVDDTEWTYSRRWSQSTGGLRRSLGSAGDRLTNTVNHYLIKSFDSEVSGSLLREVSI